MSSFISLHLNKVQLNNDYSLEEITKDNYTYPKFESIHKHLQFKSYGSLSPTRSVKVIDTSTVSYSFVNLRTHLSQAHVDLVPRNLQSKIKPFLAEFRPPIELGNEPLFELIVLCLIVEGVSKTYKKDLYLALPPEMQERLQNDQSYEIRVFLFTLELSNIDYSETLFRLLQLLSLRSENQLSLMNVLQKFFRCRDLPFDLLLHLKTLTDADFETKDVDDVIIGRFIQKAHPNTIRDIVIESPLDDFEFDSHWPIFLFDHPKRADMFFYYAAGKTVIQFSQGGFSQHNYSEVHRFILRGKRKFVAPRAIDLSSTANRQLAPITWGHLHDPTNFTVYGRTVVTQCSDGLLCYKFKRVNEDTAKFRREAVVLQSMLGRHDLLSLLPTPIGIFSCANPPNWLLDTEICSPLGGEVYVYKANPGYFTYLQDEKLSLSEWGHARRAWLHDMGAMGRDGYYFDAAPIFHNESLNRTYLPLPDCKVERKIIPIGRGGAGRLDAAFKHTQFPNVGATGARDFADIHDLNTLVYTLLPLSTDIHHDQITGQAKSDYLESNLMVRVFLVDALLLVARLKNQGRLDWKNKNLIAETADALADGAALFLFGYAKKDLEQCQKFVKEGLINWKLAASQLLFWSQNNKDGYLPYVEEGFLPQDLYGGYDVKISVKKADNFDSKIGFNSHGDQDFGPYNGPLGWDELEKFWYYISAIIIALK